MEEIEINEEDLVSLSIRIKSYLDDDIYETESETKIKKIHNMIDNAMILLNDFSNIEDTEDDLKHEIGFSYSEIISLLEDELFELNDVFGINFLLH